MSGPAILLADAEELIHQSITTFAAWAAQNWTMTEAEAQTLTKPAAAPVEYARGYREALQSLPDAAAHCLEEGDMYDE